MKTTDSSNGDAWAELLAVKTTVLTEMGASADDNAKLRGLTDWLRRELDLEAKYKGLLAEADRLLAERRSPPTVPEVMPEPSRQEAEDQSTSRAGKSGAADFRDVYLEREKQRGRHFV